MSLESLCQKSVQAHMLPYPEITKGYDSFYESVKQYAGIKRSFESYEVAALSKNECQKALAVSKELMKKEKHYHQQLYGVLEALQKQKESAQNLTDVRAIITDAIKVQKVCAYIDSPSIEERVDGLVSSCEQLVQVYTQKKPLSLPSVSYPVKIRKKHAKTVLNISKASLQVLGGMVYGVAGAAYYGVKFAGLGLAGLGQVLWYARKPVLIAGAMTASVYVGGKAIKNISFSFSDATKKELLIKEKNVVTPTIIKKRKKEKPVATMLVQEPLMTTTKKTVENDALFLGSLNTLSVLQKSLLEKKLEADEFKQSLSKKELRQLKRIERKEERRKRREERKNKL